MGSPQFAPANIGANPYLREWLNNRIDGKAMRALSIERASLIQSLKATGQSQPATILWFNPVCARLDGEIPFKIPSVIDPVVKEEDKIAFEHGGRIFKANVFTIKEPRTFPKIKDVVKTEDVEVGVYDMRAAKQIEVAHCFVVAYTHGTPSSSGMGGIVAFQGTRRDLERKKGSRLLIKVPTFTRLANREREYFTEEKDLDEVVAQALDEQKTYSNTQTQQAQSYWDQEDQRGNITPIHRDWHEFEMMIGYRQTPAPWITEKNTPTELCEGCGQPRKRATAWFCWSCARPYDPFAAFKAGELGVEHPSLNRCTPAQWQEISKIEKQRQALRKGIQES